MHLDEGACDEAGFWPAGHRIASSASSEQSDNSWVHHMDADVSTPIEQECGMVLGSIKLSPRKQREVALKWQQPKPTAAGPGR